jgi:hypothetical protein
MILLSEGWRMYDVYTVSDWIKKKAGKLEGNLRVKAEHYTIRCELDKEGTDKEFSINLIKKNKVSKSICKKIVSGHWRNCEKYDRLARIIRSDILVTGQEVSASKYDPETEKHYRTKELRLEDWRKEIAFDVTRKLFDNFDRGNMIEKVLVFYNCNPSKNSQEAEEGLYKVHYSAEVYVGYFKK